jgi:peptidoglycan/LPS O-acetylase OafA/YrhL
MKIKYRPEIDGLRAISVFSVIFYHAGINYNELILFKGGFLGVDIFFVISGYLITSIILKELVTTGSFSFKNFYERRIRRIIPALLFVILVSVPFAWLYMLPSSFLIYSKSIISSLLFSSNFFFYFQNLLYNAEDSNLNPFLHTWSLSVEEQFYIIFPILLFFLFKYFKSYLIIFFLFFFLLSLTFSEIERELNPSANFYFLHTRIWEILTGSILAYFSILKGVRPKHSTINFFFPGIGLSLIVFSIFFFDSSFNHPSLITLIPVTGTCLILWYANENELVTKLLSIKFITFFGLISYSLYLWHFPVFSFVRMSEFSQEGILNKFIFSALIIFLSIFSYYFVEKNFRNKNFKFTSVSIILSVIYFAILLFNLFALKNDGFKKRSHFPEVLVNTLNTLDYRRLSQNGIPCHNRTGENSFCIFNELDDNKGDVILLGDSLTDALLSNLVEKISKTKFRLINMSYSGNLYLPGFVLYKKTGKYIIADEKYHENRKLFLEKKINKNSYIIIFADYNYYFKEKILKFDKNDNIFEENVDHFLTVRADVDLEKKDRINFLKNYFEKTLYDLSKTNKIILLYPMPTSPEFVLNRIKKNSKNILLKNFFYLDDKLNYPRSIYKKHNKETINFLDKLKNNNIYKIKLEEIFCPVNQCIFYDNKYSYVFDNAHPSYHGSNKINRKIMDIIMNSK